VRYEILGPLRVLNNEKSSTLRARHVEVVLAALLVNANRMVTADQLIAELWHDNPPRTAMASLYVCISKLRKFLHGIGYAADPVETKSPGYALRAENDEFDAWNFELLFERGRLDAKAGRHEQASESFAAALGLWRGPALGNLRDGPMLGAFATWVEEARLQCLELMIESNLALGLHREMIGQLYSLAGEHPLRETFYGQLMLALYRAERQADALAAYRSARETLHDQLGTEPGRALSAMQRAILRTDNRLDLREPSPAADRKRTVNVR